MLVITYSFLNFLIPNSRNAIFFPVRSDKLVAPVDYLLGLLS